MKFLFKLILLLWTSYEILINGQDTISYRGMKKLNAECFPENSCLHRSPEASRGVMTSTVCSCDRLCSQFGTCCKDSPYVGIPSPAIRPHCKTVHSPFSSAFFMIDRCPGGDNVSLEWRSLCGDDKNGEDIILKFAPVTSLSTSITYKNYFCFKCHEMGDDVFYWDVRLLKESDISDVNRQSNFTMGAEYGTETTDGSSSRIRLEYNAEKKTWMAAVGKDNNTISVVLEIKVPKEIRSLVLGCDPNVITNCSTIWKDANVRDKCVSYTAAIYIAKEGRFLKYKNAYCALCNFESLDDMYCMNSSASVLGYASAGYSVRNVEHVGDSETYGGRGQHVQEGGGYRSGGGYAAQGEEYRPGGGGYVTRDGGYSTRGVPGEGRYGPRGGEIRRNGGDETNRRYSGTMIGGYGGRISTVRDEKFEGARRGGYGGEGGSGGYGRGTRPGYGGGESREYGGGAVSSHRGGYMQGDSTGYGEATGEGFEGRADAGYGGGYRRGGDAGYSGGYTSGGNVGFASEIDAGYGGEGDSRGDGSGTRPGYGGGESGGYGGGAVSSHRGGYRQGGGAENGRVAGEGYEGGASAGYGGGYRRGGNAGYGGATGEEYGEVYRRGSSAGYGLATGGGYGAGVGGYGREYSRGYWETPGGRYGGPYPTPPYLADTGYGRGYVRRSSAAFGGSANTGQRRVTGKRKRYFSFVDILRVNKFKEESPRRTQKCDKNFLWDPYSETCLELICDNPSLELKEGKCV